MKLYKLFIATALCSGGFCLSSCNDLEQMPNNEYTDGNFWTKENAELMVMTAYSQLYNAGTMWADERIADNMWNGYRSEDTHVMRRGLARPTTGIFGWNGWWAGIKSCHTFLDNAYRIEGLEETTLDRLNAETRFIRDAIYFRLTTFYGAIPFFTEDPTLEWTLHCTRTPHSEIIDYIKQDVEDLLPSLPTKESLPDSERGRLTQAAAAMLLARVALMESDWENVVKWCQNIVDGKYGNYSLFPSYEGLFQEENEYNDEVIFDRGYTPLLYTWSDYHNMHPKSFNNGNDFVSWTPTQSLVDTYLTLGGYKWNEAGTDFDPENPYENRDPRMDATIVRDGSEMWDSVLDEIVTINIKDPDSANRCLKINEASDYGSTYTGYFARKWYSPTLGDDRHNSGLNIIMMRYADVLLMLAEAKEALGQMNAQVWNETIRPIRERARFTAAKALDYPGGDVKQIIRDERRVELALEGLRWFDIKRWRAGKEYLDGPVKGCTYVGGSEVLDNYSFDENRDYLWAIPQSEIDLNPNLSQNSGY